VIESPRTRAARSSQARPPDGRGPFELPPSLLYHGVARLPAGAGYVERALFVEPDTFSRQMEQLEQRGFRTLRLEEYVAVLEGRLSPSRRCLLTFDDGYGHLDETVTPVLRRHGYSAVVFVPLAHVGGSNVWDRSRPRLFGTRIMGEEHLRSLDSDVWQVESHGMHHVDLRALDPTARRRELREGREYLSLLLGREVTALAYPYGLHDAGVREDAASTGFELAFTAAGYGAADRLMLPRRAISGWDPLPLFRARTARYAPALYRVEDSLREVLAVRHALRSRLDGAGR
jgi:peptidoglycan/xylan/chitin deacetylase (PgdA/CDA1 family)